MSETLDFGPLLTDQKPILIAELLATDHVVAEELVAAEEELPKPEPKPELTRGRASALRAKSQKMAALRREMAALRSQLAASRQLVSALLRFKSHVDANYASAAQDHELVALAQHVQQLQQNEEHVATRRPPRVTRPLRRREDGPRASMRCAWPGCGYQVRARVRATC